MNSNQLFFTHHLLDTNIFAYIFMNSVFTRFWNVGIICWQMSCCWWAHVLFTGSSFFPPSTYWVISACKYFARHWMPFPVSRTGFPSSLHTARSLPCVAGSSSIIITMTIQRKKQRAGKLQSQWPWQGEGLLAFSTVRPGSPFPCSRLVVSVLVLPASSPVSGWYKNSCTYQQ